jgi:hypothetical protein
LHSGNRFGERCRRTVFFLAWPAFSPILKLNPKNDRLVPGCAASVKVNTTGETESEAVMDPRRLAVWCGTVVFAGWGAAGLLDFGWPSFENATASFEATSFEARRPSSAIAAAEPIATVPAAPSEHALAAAIAKVDAALPAADPARELEPPSAPAVASANTERAVAAAEATGATASPAAAPSREPETSSVQVASANTAQRAAVTDASGAIALPTAPMQQPETPPAPIKAADNEHGVAAPDAAIAGVDVSATGSTRAPETLSVQVASADTGRGVAAGDAAIAAADVTATGSTRKPETPSVQVASADSGHGAVGDEPVGAPLSKPEGETAPVPAAPASTTNAVTDAAAAGADLPAPAPTRADETPSMQVASANPQDLQGSPNEAVRSAETPEDCLVEEACIDRYLWSAYQRAPKVDAIRVAEQIKVTVKRRGKTRTVSRTITKVVDEDFTWKDPKAAEKAGMPLMDYVIGGMDRSFKQKLYHALRALDDAGLVPGITSGFRDNYRQSLATGNKAATDRSYHGGSLRGGYGHGLAADLVSVKGETRAQRYASSESLWKWIDAHGMEYGVARPYLDRDPPHVGPLDGKEYADKRGFAQARLAESESRKHHHAAGGEDHGKAKHKKIASLRARST